MQKYLHQGPKRYQTTSYCIIVLVAPVLPVVDTAADVDSKSGVLQVFDSNGCIADWDGLECIFEHIFYEQLGWPEGDEGYVLCTENVPCMPRSSRERLTQTLFETFNVKGCYMLDSSIACLYAAGKVSGMTVDVGHTGTNVVQVRHPSGFKDVVPPHAIIQGLHANPRFYLIRDIVKESHVQVVDGAAVVGTSDRHAVGGAMLDELLQGFVINDGPAMSQQDLQSFKEKCAIAADSREEYVDVMEEKKSVETVEHTLPDGQTVKIGKDRYATAPCIDTMGCHHMRFRSQTGMHVHQTRIAISRTGNKLLWMQVHTR